MCVQLRPVIKDDSMLQAVFKVCLKYTSTQKPHCSETFILAFIVTPESFSFTVLMFHSMEAREHSIPSTL